MSGSRNQVTSPLETDPVPDVEPWSGLSSSLLISLLPSARELPEGPQVHTVAVDQNDGQHVILAQHLPRPASALSPVRPLRGGAYEPSLSPPESAGPKGRLRASGASKQASGTRLAARFRGRRRGESETDITAQL